MSEVKRFRADWRHVVETEFDDAQYVLVSDYDEAIARLELLSGYDESKERELFEAWIPSFWNKRKHLDDDGDWIYEDDLTQGALIGWLECAKSRARSAE